MKLSRALLFSIAFHFLVAGIFLLRWKEKAESPPEKMPTEIMVDFALSDKAGEAQGASTSGLRAKQNSFSAIVPQWNPHANIPSAPGGNMASVPALHEASEAIVRGGSNSAVAWVYRQVKNGLGYPAPFIRHGITGKVEVQLGFDAGGKFQPSLFRVESVSPYLRIYVYRLLENHFRDPIPLELRNWKDSLEVMAHIQFTFVEHEAAVDMMLPAAPVVGRHMYFAKTKVQSKLEWELGPIKGFALVPAVSLDVFSLFDSAQRAIKGAPAPDDLAPYRNDPLF